MNKRNISGAICMAIFALALILVGCPSPTTDNKGSAAPTKTPPGLSLNTMERTLTLSFDKNIKSIKDTSKIIVYKKSAGATTGVTPPPPQEIEQDKFTATAVDGKLVITLVDAITAGDIFYVELQALAVTDEHDVDNTDSITSPKVTIPDIFVTDVAINKPTLTLTFNISLSDKDDSKIEVYKGDAVLEPSAYTIGDIGSSGDVSTLMITLTDVIGASDTYTVKFQAGALTVGDAPSEEAFEIEIDTSGPGFANPEDALSLDVASQTLTVSFNKHIASKTDGNIKVLKTPNGGEETPLTITADYTIAINGVKVVMTLTALNEGDTYRVKFLVDAVKGTNNIGNAEITTEAETVLIPPTLKSKTFDLVTKKLIATFKKAIAILSKSKIEMYKNDEKLALTTDYTVALNTDTTKVEITLITALSEGQKYRVKFLAGAVEDAVNKRQNEAFEIDVISGPGFANPDDALILDVASKTLTVSFNKRIDSKTDGNIKVLKTPNGGEEAALTITTDYTIDINDMKVVITLIVSKLDEGDTYRVKFLADAVKGTNNIGNETITTEAETVPAPPTLKSKTFNLVTKKLIATFKKAIAMKDISKIEVHKDDEKLTLTTDYTVAMSADKTTVEITLKESASKGQKYRVKFLLGAVEDAVNKRQNEAFEIEIDTSGPVFANPEDALSFDVASKTLTVSFNKSIDSKTDGNIQVLKTTKTDGVETPLTITIDYTIVIDGTKVVITLKAAELNEDTYKVKFLVDAVKGTNNIGNAEITTESETVPPSPTLKSKDLVRDGKKLTATFKKAIAMLSKSKIEVYKDDKKLALTTDYTIALNADTTKVEITLMAAPSMSQTYQVKFLAGAVEDVADTQPNKSMETMVYNTGNIGVWKKVANAPWTAREGFASVVFNNRIYVMGGQKQEGELNDVWYSEDGTSWQEATSDAKWKPREGLTSVVFKNKIWIMGGCSGTNPDKAFGPEGNNCRSVTKTYYNDVWSSSDGVTWNEEVSNRPENAAMWDIRAYHTSVVFKGKIWVIGGFAKNSTKWPDEKGMYVNDIWHSADGSTWKQAKTKTKEKWHNYNYTSDDVDNPRQRRFEKFAALDDYQYWSARYGHTSVVFENKLWIIGGSSGKHQKGLAKGNWFLSYARRVKVWPWRSAYRSDVYSSADGTIWKSVTKKSNWTARKSHASVVFDNKIWVIGGRTVGTGKDRISVNDVWHSEDGQAWTQMDMSKTVFLTERDSFQVVVFKGKLYVMGGGAKKSGVTWTYMSEDVDKQYNEVWTYGLP